MNQMKIAVGTASDQKIGYLEEILKELEIDYSLKPFPVSSGVRDQPLSNQETKTGSINRARNALSQSIDSDFAIGIEVGYHPNKNGKYKMFCWSTIVDNKGNIVSARSHQLLLPKFYQDLLQENKYLCDYVDQYLSQNQTSFYKYLALILKTRQPIIQTSLKTVLINYLVSD